MTNRIFSNEHITADDLYFVCYMIERTARRLKQPNKYVVNQIGKDELARNLALAQVLHCENPDKVSADWEEQYLLGYGAFDVTDVNKDLCQQIPTTTQMGKVYKRLIMNTMKINEDYPDAIVRVYNDPICATIDNYNCSAYYEPSQVIADAYCNGGF